nr:PREDICTED: 26S proteasome non-ATPase regulatory subunit 7 [Opisthocomus hoazin]
MPITQERGVGKAARARALGLQVHGEHPAQVLAGDSRGPEHPERLRNGGPDSVVSSFYPERAMLLVRAQKTAGLGAGCSRMGLTLGSGYDANERHGVGSERANSSLRLPRGSWVRAGPEEGWGLCSVAAPSAPAPAMVEHPGSALTPRHRRGLWHRHRRGVRECLGRVEFIFPICKSKFAPKLNRRKSCFIPENAGMLYHRGERHGLRCSDTGPTQASAEAVFAGGFARQPLLDELAACESHGEDQQGLGNSRLTGSPAGGKGPKQKVTPESFPFRIGKVGNQKRVVGVLLGSWQKKILDVSNSFAVPFDEDDKDDTVWFLDHDYLENMYGMFKKVNARERIVGWYHTGPKLHKNDIAINELMKRYCPNSVLVIIDVKPKDLGLPTEAYISVEEVHDDGTPTSKTFEHVTSEIGAEEAEEVGVEHLLRDIKDTTVGTLSQRITNQVHGLKGLNSKLLDIRSYLEKVAMGKLPINHQIIYHLQDVFNLLPDVNLQEFVKAFYLKTNDQMVVVYLASLIRSVVALHNLINNKIANRDAEKKEGQEKEESKKERKDEKEKDKEKSDVKKEEKKEKK